MFKVQLRTNCKICGTKIDRPSRYRTFCSKKCRNKFHNKKHYPHRNKLAQFKRAEYRPGKLKCMICGGWYVQVGSHIVQKHKITAREYREIMNLPVKRGVVPSWFRKLKGDQALKNKTFLNLKSGKKHWFKKNDKRATIKSLFWKGHRRQSDEFYQQ